MITQRDSKGGQARLKVLILGKIRVKGYDISLFVSEFCSVEYNSLTLHIHAKIAKGLLDKNEMRKVQ